MKSGGADDGTCGVSRVTVMAPPFDLESPPDRPAVFVVETAGGRPYLGRTAVLRRRLKRLLGERAGQARILNLRERATRVEYRLAASRLALSLMYYEQARSLFPDEYAAMMRLRPAPFVRIVAGAGFARTVVSTRLGGGAAFQYGPFRSRATAERFEQEALDLFQVRRCQEELAPSPEHPGCIYGEMMKCLRPCQEVVGREEYASEVERLKEFMMSGGRSLLEPAQAARERFSQELEFEQAARQHARVERIEQVMRQRDELAGDVSRLCGVAVAASVEPGAVELRFLLGGAFAPAVEFSVAASGAEAAPLDRRLREVAAALVAPRASARERGEHLALLARWYYSSYRDGEWIAFDSLETLPYRRLVRAISKTASSAQTSLFEH